MKHFYSAADVDDIPALVQEAIALKTRQPVSQIGTNKTLVMLFFNPSLRTRLSTQKAAQSIGMQVISMNAADNWRWELEEKVVMNTDKAEHIKDAARVISQYGDVIAIRSFPSLVDKDADYQDRLLRTFMKYATVPVINLESSTRHPCQSLADLMTIQEHQKSKHNKVAITWAPHPKALPQAVTNSFLEWIAETNNEVIITHPKGYDLAPEFTQNYLVTNRQEEALEGADFVYVKNWSSYQQYGKILTEDPSWVIDTRKMDLTNEAKVLHCLPVRRNVVIADEVLDSKNSLVYEQANNRTYAAMTVLQELLK